MFDLISQAAAQPLGAIGVTASSTTDVTNIVVAGAHAIGVAVLAAFVAFVRGHLKDQNAQKVIITAAENAVSYAENRIGVKGGQPYTVPVASTIGRIALDYLNAHAGGAINQLGLDDATLSRLIVAKMPEVTGGGIDEKTMTGITASASGKAPAPVDYSQLIPIFEPMIEAALAKHLNKTTESKPVA